MNDVAFIALVNVLEVELIWSSFFPFGSDWAGRRLERGKNRAQMSLLMIRLYALFAFAIEFFSPNVRIERYDSYVVSNPESKIENPNQQTGIFVNFDFYCLFI